MGREEGENLSLDHRVQVSERSKVVKDCSGPLTRVMAEWIDQEERTQEEEMVWRRILKFQL